MKTNYFYRHMILLLAFLLPAHLFWAQTPTLSCGNVPGSLASKNPPPNGSCGQQSPIFNNFLRYKENFIPTGQVNERTVRKNVKLRFMVTDPGTSTQKNFRQQNIQDLQTIVTWLNGFFSNCQAPNKPQTNICGSCYIPDMRIHFELQGITFFPNTDTAIPYTIVYNSQNQPVDTYYNYSVPDLSPYTVGEDSVFNIFFCYFNNGIPKGMYAGITNNTGNIAKFNFYSDPKRDYIILANTYQRFLNSDLWGVTILLMHELFHEYGLWHLWDGTETCTETDPEYLADIFNTGSLKHCPLTGGFNDCDQSLPTYPNFGCNNNVMSVRGYNWSSPMQQGIIQRESYLGRMSRYTYPMESPNTTPWVVTNNQVWDFPVRMFQDIRVKPGATLTIKCEVQMPPNARIVVENGGHLIVDGGLVTSYHGKSTWFGIELKAYSGMDPIPANQGFLELKNGAIIEHAITGVRNFCSSDNPGVGGGVIKAANSTFLNCRKAVELRDYPTKSYYYNGASQCSFDQVKFIYDDKLQGSPGDMFTSWNVLNGVVVNKCSFRNDAPYSMPVFSRGTGIYTTHTGIKVQACDFHSLQKGVYATGITRVPTRTVFIQNSQFSDITENILIGASAYADVKANIVHYMHFNRLGSYGIYLDRTYGSYVGCSNQINGNYFGSQFSSSDRGLIANETGTYTTHVINNSFNNVMAGLQTQGTNKNLYVLCNNYQSDNFAWMINSQTSGNQYYFRDQGTAAAPSGNKFVNNQYGIFSYLSNSWTYYAGNGPNETTSWFGPMSFFYSTSPSRCTRPLNCYFAFDLQVLQQVQTEYQNFVAAGLKYSDEARIVFGDVIRAYSELNMTDDLQAFLENENDDDARKMLIPLYIDRGKYTNAARTLSSLSLPPNEATGYTNYYSLIAAVQQSNRSYDDLTPAEHQTLDDLANGNLEVSPYARALLEHIYGTPWEHPIEELPADMPKKGAAQGTGDLLVNHTFEAAPNPANQSTTIRAYIDESETVQKPVVIIRSADGATLYQSQVLKAGMNTLEVDLQPWLPGIYFYSLVKEGKVTVTKKLSVVK